MKKYKVMVDTVDGTYSVTGSISLIKASDYIDSKADMWPESNMYIVPCYDTNDRAPVGAHYDVGVRK